MTRSEKSPSLDLRTVGNAVAFALLAGVVAAPPARAATPAPIPVAVASEVPVEVLVHVSSTTNESSLNLVYTVPAGKMLTIDSMTLYDEVPETGVGLSALVLNRTGFVLNSVASISAPASTVAAFATQPMHLHVVAGNVVLANVFRTGTAGILASISLSGHLDAMP